MIDDSDSKLRYRRDEKLLFYRLSHPLTNVADIKKTSARFIADRKKCHRQMSATFVADKKVNVGDILSAISREK